MSDGDKKIGVMVETEVGFFSVRPLLKALKKKYHDLTVFILDWPDNTDGYQQIFAGTAKLLRDEGYEPELLKNHKGEEFDLYLAPYVYGNEEIKFKCSMKYEYGTTNVKPKLTYTPDVNGAIDVFLCQSTVNCEALKAYGATYLVDNLRFNGLKKKRREGGGKKRLLFAPTYNDEISATKITEVIRELRKNYYVIVKAHHGTNYLSWNKKQRNALESEADEFYTSDKSLSELIMEADVGLFGNSSAYAEAMYAGLPCAIFAEDPDCFRLGDIHTTQDWLIRDGILPWAKKVDEVRERVGEAMSAKYRKRQEEWAVRLLPRDARTGVSGYMKIIDYYLSSREAQDYCWLRHYLLDEQRKSEKKLRDEIAKKEKKLTVKNREIEILEKRNGDLIEVMNGGLHRIASKVYEIRRKISGKN